MVISQPEKDYEVATAVNLWGLEKSTELKAHLLVLAHYLGESGWALANINETSQDGVYLMYQAEQDLRAYLHVHGQRKGRAGLHLEYPANPSFDIREDLTSNQLVEMVAMFFDLNIGH